MSITSTQIRRLLATMTIAVAAIAATTSAAQAAQAPHRADSVSFTSHVYLTPPPAGSDTGRFTIVGDTCSLKAGSAAPIPCTFVGYGTVGPAGGTATGYITSRRGLVVLDETYHFTSPTTSVGSGPATEYRPGFGITRGSFTGAFTTAPTADPNVLLDWGTFSIAY